MMEKSELLAIFLGNPTFAANEDALYLVEVIEKDNGDRASE